MMVCNFRAGPAFAARRRGILAVSAATALIITLVAWMATAGVAEARPAFSAIAVDASNGRILYQSHIDSPRYPASLTKVMTLYLLFEDLRAGKVSLSARFTVSRHAAAQQPSKLGLKPGSTISVSDAIGALVTKSANDIAVTVAEGLEGSESAFAARMTRTARALGMTRTTFHNASGLPDNRQKTTARDMATLGLRIQRDFPKQFAHFSTQRFSYDGRSFRNHNHLLGRLRGVDGIKTGYTRVSGFNLICSIERDGKRMVGVVMGGRTSRARNAYMKRMLERMFKSGKLKPELRVAALAGHPPGYVPKPVTQALRVDTPPLPRPRPDLAQNNNAKPAVVEAAIGTDVASAPETAPEPAKAEVQATSFESVQVEEAGKSDSLKMKTTGSIGNAAQIVGEKALAQPAIKPSAEPAQKETWNIQVGAFPTPDGARRRIDAALSTGIGVLDGKSAFTMRADVGGDTIYRARFFGFNEHDARHACRLLKRKGLGCFPLAPSAANSG